MFLLVPFLERLYQVGEGKANRWDIDEVLLERNQEVERGKDGSMVQKPHQRIKLGSVYTLCIKTCYVFQPQEMSA